MATTADAAAPSSGGPPGPALAADDVLAGVAATHDANALLDLLDRGASALVTSDLIHRLVPLVDRLVALEYTDHPWGALPAGVAICAVDRTRGRDILTCAREHFERVEDPVGLSWACLLEGLQDLGEGRVERAQEWWDRSVRLGRDTDAAREFAAVHLALGAYMRGDLTQGTFIAERSIYAGRRSDNPRVEAIAAVYLALIQWWHGDFDAVTRAAQTGQAAMERIANPLDWYEAPLLDAALAVAAYAAGDSDSGERHFDTALARAAEGQNEWYTAILRTIRAQASAAHDRERSLRDTRLAFGYFDSIGEQWWSRWALIAYIVAQRENGELDASVAAAEELLAHDLNPLERGRGLVELGTSLALLGRNEAAVNAFNESVSLLIASNASFLACRAHLAGAALDSRRRERLVREARRIAEPYRTQRPWIALLRGARVELRLLGRPELLVDGKPRKFRTRHELELLAFLAVAGAEGRSREATTSALWPADNGERVVNRLNTALNHLRDTLSPATRIVTTHRRLHLELDPGECDVVDALAALRDPVQQPRATRVLQQPFLAGSYSEWVVEYQHMLDGIRGRER